MQITHLYCFALCRQPLREGGGAAKCRSVRLCEKEGIRADLKESFFFFLTFGKFLLIFQLFLCSSVILIQVVYEKHQADLKLYTYIIYI